MYNDQLSLFLTNKKLFCNSCITVVQSLCNHYKTLQNSCRVIVETGIESY